METNAFGRIDLRTQNVRVRVKQILVYYSEKTLAACVLGLDRHISAVGWQKACIDIANGHLGSPYATTQKSAVTSC